MVHTLVIYICVYSFNTVNYNFSRDIDKHDCFQSKVTTMAKVLTTEMD